VVHSTTKYLSGHGVITGGVVVSTHIEYILDRVRKKQVYLGSATSPFEAWLANLGLKTFELRMQRHCENAQALAEFLAHHPKIEKVYYPGLKGSRMHELARKQMLAFGGMVSFEVAGGTRACLDLIDHLEIATLAVSLGNVDTLIQHPASMTHQDVPPDERHAIGLRDNLVRLSVGVENLGDLIADFNQALEKI
jgi:methionine-gamma-lyase